LEEQAVTARAGWDVAIIGGGPAGLNAALVLGRCLRRVLVIDAGKPRNAAAPALHGFLSRDGITPGELLRIGRQQLRAYETVKFREGTASAIRLVGRRFEVRVAGVRHSSRKILFATGVVDRLPEVPGAAELYGRGVYHCPYCDGYEISSGPVAVYGEHTKGMGLVRTLLCWTRDIVLCTNGPARLPKEERNFLDRHGVVLREDKLERLAGRSKLEMVVFAGGEEMPRAGLFFNTGQYQHSELPAKLGCREAKGAVVTDKDGQTTVRGAYLAGDASKDVQLAIVAAAEGAKAAFAINKALTSEDFG
jgi:thioredoxin reductase